MNKYEKLIYIQYLDIKIVHYYIYKNVQKLNIIL
jgi:hypothetical protein